MDKTAFYKLSYGLYLLTAKAGGKENGCIINTAIQCASDPKLISICVINKNLTCDMIKETGTFNISVLGEDAGPELFKRFGMQSGRDVDKESAAHLTLEEPSVIRTPGIREVPLTLECKVLYQQDQVLSEIPDEVISRFYSRGTDAEDFHTAYIAQIVDAYIIKEDA